VFNDTGDQGAPVRKKQTGGRIEVLIERLLPGGEVLAQVHAGRAAKPGSTLQLDGAGASVIGREGEFYACASGRRGRLDLPSATAAFAPPYIAHAPQSEDRSRYQTVYARAPGAVAAPTAGLHSTRLSLARSRSAASNSRM